MKITRLGFLAAIALALLSSGLGCGSASAPPVDLPAPVAGFIDVPAPDANGDVTITGDSGSVPGDVIVMVVNESSSASIVIPILNFIIPSAYAEDELPATCDLPGHACTWSDEAGAFVLVIAAAEGDSLAIGIINSSGQWISELLTQTVPSADPEPGPGPSPDPDPEPEAYCSGKSLSGEVVDLVVAPDGKPILLKQGSDTAFNQLVIGTGSSKSTVSIDGCHARSLALYKVTSEKATVVVMSPEDKLIWRGTYTSGNISGSKAFAFDKSPMHAAFAGSSNDAIVALGSSSGITLSRISLLGGGIKSSGTEIAGVTRSLRVTAHEMEMGSGEWIGALLADSGEGTDFLLTVFNPGTLDLAFEADASDPVLLKASVDHIYDVAFWTDGSYFMRMLLVGNSVVAGSPKMGRTMYCKILGPSVDELNPANYPVNSANTSKIMEINSSYESASISGITRLSQEQVAYGPSKIISTGPSGEAYFTTLDDIKFGKANDMEATMVASGHDLVAVWFDSISNKTFVADATAGEALEITP